MTPDLGFVHRYVPGEAPDRTPLLLLHGTGGDEGDLIPLATSIAPGAAVLSPRGNVMERGMPRFFRRRAEGVFDPDEVRRGADDLARFVADARRTYGLAAPVAVGYSNGANVAAVLLARHPGLLSGAALLRPMTVLEDVAEPGPDAPVLILSGAMDPIATVADARRLGEILRLGGARVRQEVLKAGHSLTPDDGRLVCRWLSESECGWIAS